MKRLNQLPDAPCLPLAHATGQVKQVHMSRRRVEIPDEDWARFKAHAEWHGITPSIALATCLGAVMARWCSQPRLLLHMMLPEPQPTYPSVNAMADSTNRLPLDVMAEGADFHVMAQANQQTFALVCEHRHGVGVELWNAVCERSGADAHGTRVVFASRLDDVLFVREAQPALDFPAEDITPTPQPRIDHLIYLQNDAVVLQWDSSDALFPDGLMDAMFAAYAGLVRHLSSHPEGWQKPVPDLMPAEQRLLRQRINHTQENEPPPEGLLHDGFFRNASVCPDAVAVCHGGRHLTYGQLAEQARRCAGVLVARGVQPGDTVAISMPKGIGQIIAVLGILYAGAVYVPVALDQPQTRRDSIYHASRTAVVLICQDALADSTSQTSDSPRFLCWQDAVAHPPLPKPAMRDYRSMSNNGETPRRGAKPLGSTV